MRRVRALPGVEAASIGQRLPLTATDSSDRTVEIEGYTPARGEELSVYYSSVGPGYFDTLQMSLVEGRDFTPRDTADALLNPVRPFERSSGAPRQGVSC